MHSVLKGVILHSTSPALSPTPPSHTPRSKSRPLPTIPPPSAIHPRIRHSRVPAHIGRRTRVWRLRGVAAASVAAAAGVAVSGIAAGVSAAVASAAGTAGTGHFCGLLVVLVGWLVGGVFLV